MVCASWSSSLVFAFAWWNPGFMEGDGKGADGDEGGAGFASSRFIIPRVLGGSDRLGLEVEVAAFGRCWNAR